MGSIEQAINALCDHTQPQHIRANALELTATAKRDPGFYKFAMQKILELNLDNPNSLNYLFWYLQALEEILNKSYSLFPPPAHTEIQSFLFVIIESRLDIIQKHYGVLNKFALLYVRVIQTDFPDIWPNAFNILIERVRRTNDHTRLFLFVMKAFSEEFVEELGYLTQEQLRRSNLLKDAIREKVLISACEIWKQILNGSDIQLVFLTLQVISPYIIWIPLELSLNFFGDFMKYLNNAETQIPSLRCIDSLVNKKMDPLKKLEIIKKLNLIEFIRVFSLEPFDMLSDIPKTIANLIDSLGENLLDIETGEEFQTVLEFALKCLDNVILI
jgi:Exportin 1-like protein